MNMKPSPRQEKKSVLRAKPRSNAVNDTAIDLDQTEEATLICEVSDAALEAAAATVGGAARAFSFSFSSYHLSCC